jgi:hypothetical protein
VRLLLGAILALRRSHHQSGSGTGNHRVLAATVESRRRRRHRAAMPAPTSLQREPNGELGWVSKKGLGWKDTRRASTAVGGSQTHGTGFSDAAALQRQLPAAPMTVLGGQARGTLRECGARLRPWLFGLSRFPACSHD